MKPLVEDEDSDEKVDVEEEDEKEEEKEKEVIESHKKQISKEPQIKKEAEELPIIPEEPEASGFETLLKASEILSQREQDKKLVPPAPSIPAEVKEEDMDLEKEKPSFLVEHDYVLPPPQWMAMIRMEPCRQKRMRTQHPMKCSWTTTTAFHHSLISEIWSSRRHLCQTLCMSWQNHPQHLKRRRRSHQ